MSEQFQIKEYEVTVEQGEMTYPKFIDHVNGELKKFADMIAALQAEFIAPQDVGGVGGLICRFHPINGYPAIRQINQFNPKTKTWLVFFDCRVLEPAVIVPVVTTIAETTESAPVH